MEKAYYETMLDRGRLFPVKKDGRLVCVIAYYIGEKEDLDRFSQSDPWTVLEDKASGKLLYINQLITDKDKRNPALSYEIWRRFKLYIKQEYPSVMIIHWRRWKNNRVYLFKEKIKEG